MELVQGIVDDSDGIGGQYLETEVGECSQTSLLSRAVMLS